MANDLGGNTIAPAAAPTDDEKLWGTIAEATQFTWVVGIPGIIGPIVALLVKSDSEYVKAHAMQAIFFQIGLIIITVICTILTFVTCGIGFFLYIIPIVLGILYPILGTLRANEGAIYSYPVTGQFVK